MGGERVRKFALAALGPLLLASPVHGNEPPPANQLEGAVVFHDDGRPAAGVAVGMAHRRKGYLAFDDTAFLTHGDHKLLFGVFPVPNGRYSCYTVTDAAGRFVLRDFAAPDEDWLIAAGDTEHGYALQVNVKPKDFKSQPLRLELEKPASLEVTTPKGRQAMGVYTEVALAGPPAAPVAADERPGGTTDDEGVSERVFFASARTSREDKGKPRRIGPLPARQRYEVTALGLGNNMPYQPVLLKRVVEAAAGETAQVTLEPKDGLTVTGRVTSSDDKPLGKVNVKVKTADGTVIGGVSDGEGKYELRGVPAGTHTLQLLRHAKRTAPG